MEPVKKVSLPDMVIEKLKDSIKRGEYKPGQRLPTEPELSSMLQVGRGSVREALKRLETMGLIRIRHGEGAFVVDSLDIASFMQPLTTMLILDKPQLLELMQAREVIEGGTVRFAAHNATDEEIEELHQLVQKMKEHINNPEEFIKHDLAFHMAIAKASGNSVLSKVLNLIRDLFLEEQKTVVMLPGAAERAYEYHLKIYEAIKERDADKSGKIMLEHLEDIEKAIMKSFN
ncbi:MAG: FadR/GntR family transcriptional regulator [bacterium]